MKPAAVFLCLAEPGVLQGRPVSEGRVAAHAALLFFDLELHIELRARAATEGCADDVGLAFGLHFARR